MSDEFDKKEITRKWVAESNRIGLNALLRSSKEAKREIGREA
jgi:hypothetical protein